MPTSKDDAPKIMDVSKPGKTAPPASAKPVIVTNRPMLKQDPMMATPDGMEKSAVPGETSPISRTAKTVNVLQPTEPTKADAAEPVTVKVTAPPAPKVEDLIAAKTAAVKPEAAPKAESIDQGSTPENPAAPITAPEPARTDSENPSSPEKSDTPSAPEEAPTITPSSSIDGQDEEPDEDGADSQLAPNQALEEAKQKEEEAKAARQAEEEKIIASRQYYLPMSTVTQRRGLDRVLLVLALVLIVALVWMDIVLDAGIIHIPGVHAFTHFFTK